MYTSAKENCARRNFLRGRGTTLIECRHVVASALRFSCSIRGRRDLTTGRQSDEKLLSPSARPRGLPKYSTPSPSSLALERAPGPVKPPLRNVRTDKPYSKAHGRLGAMEDVRGYTRALPASLGVNNGITNHGDYHLVRRGRVRPTDRPSNAFIIILNHIFSPYPATAGFHSVSFAAPPPLPPSRARQPPASLLPPPDALP